MIPPLDEWDDEEARWPGGCGLSIATGLACWLLLDALVKACWFG